MSKTSPTTANARRAVGLIVTIPDRATALAKAKAGPVAAAVVRGAIANLTNVGAPGCPQQRATPTIVGTVK